MTPERWRAVDAILQGALACPADERDAWVAAACGGDTALRREVASLLAAHERTGALDRLSAAHARCGQVVECRFFGGLSVEETAEALAISVETVGRDWRMARAWLRTELSAAA